MPPLAERVALYGVPTVTDGSDLVVIESGRIVGATLMLSNFEVLCAGDPESVSLMVKLEEPAAEGVPEIWPLMAPSVSPAGSWPELMLQV